jgi:hypothetical protein
VSDIVKCIRCNRILIDEEFSIHICTPATKDYKEIMIDFYIITKDPQGRETILAKGLDGTMYTLLVSQTSGKISISDDRV